MCKRMTWRLGLLCLVLWARTGAALNNPPLFTVGVDSASFPELTEEDPTFVIYTVSATDLDGDNVTYYIPTNSLNSDKFRVDSETGEVFTQDDVVLDREVLAPDNDPLELYIAAQDGNDHGVDDDQFQLFIILQDFNDNHPSISALFPPAITVAEDTPRGSLLLTVEATDADRGANALVFYYLQMNSSLFSLHHQTGELRLEEDLDYDDEDNRNHIITVIAEDQGDSPLRDSKSLTVTTSDVNDLRPIFEPASYSRAIHENITQGQVVETVSARDGDTGVDDKVFYTLEDAGNDLINDQLSFVIDSEMGEISVNVTSLDRETHPSYTLTVTATEVNDTSKVTTATVFITVLDNNDNLPTFDQANYAANVSELEDSELGRTLLTVSATDKDTGPNAEFMYRLEDLRNSSSALPFAISSDGDITLTGPLDFEETEDYLFNVIAEEELGGANGSARVRLYVDNKNDVSPVFQPVQYYGNISEGVEEGAFIEQVMATDGDKGVFGEITYTMLSGHFDDFYINTTAAGGAVFTNRSLDYEARSSYTIIIQATDMAEEGEEARTAAVTAVLEVEVVNINDNRPVFDRTNLTVQLAEESAPGTTVASLVVSDNDGEDFSERTFSITGGNDLGNFTFDPDLENIVVTSVELDYDLYPDLRMQELTIVVNDTVYTDQITLTVELVDINDNAPLFENTSYQFAVYEEVPPGWEVGRVVAVDADSGDLGDVVYSLADSGKFVINSMTGVITTRGSVDREDTATYSVTVTATDQDPNVAARRSQSVPATITVLDINDNDPQFSPDTYDFDLVENTDTVELPITASDRDSGTNAEIIFELISGNTNNAFVIDADSGVVTRNASLTLDREEVDSYLITVLATDNGMPPNNATATISITILDENDEEPIFTPSSYNVSIDEDIRTNMLVYRVTASDRDTPPNAMLQFSIVSVAGPPEPDPASSDPAPPSGTFTIDPLLGDIRTQGVFDREAFEGPYVLQVVVGDNGVGVSLSGTAEVTVYLTDVNDNDPVFQPATYSVTLDEELPKNQTLALVTATDLDAGSNQNLTYSISSVVALNNIEDQSTVASLFRVDPLTGLVVTAASLDYEFVQRYKVTVTATDDGDNQRSSSATITVTVADVNDHTPQFSQDDYLLTISEATLRNTRFPILEVTDLDSGDNSRLTFTADITSPFSVDSESGEVIVTETLDYEANTVYFFNVNVTDNGDIARMNTTTVTVMLEDVNDNAPVFHNDSYSVTISEGDYSVNNDIITTVLATDQDSGIYARVSYSLLPSNNPLFSLDNTTGELSVVADVDFEALNSAPGATQLDMQLVVQASDGAVPALTSSVTVTVTITDENDNAPVFEGMPYEAVLRENTAPGEEVLVVRATDGDGNRNGVVRYSISDTENFSIDEVTGIITTGTDNDSSTAALYDFESGPPVYTFTVYATDNGTEEQRSSAEVTVTIEDVNDNSPEITSVNPASVLLLESTAVDSTVPVIIMVNDDDVGENAAVDYQLSDDGGLFAVSDNGVIRLAGQLDREAVAQYNITITVTDRGQPRRSAESKLLVNVLDVNDNAPTFEQDSYTAVLREDTASGEMVGSVIRVLDPDSRAGGAGDLTFEVMGVNNEAFSLEATPVDGGWWEVTMETATTYDYEDGPRSYELVVKAMDRGTPAMSGNTTLTITITDVNDKSPTFSSPSYSLSLPENLPVGGAVGSVLATDPDGANNGIVSYNFAENTTASIRATFSLDPSTGILELLTTINFESGPMVYEFSVVAMDDGSPSLSSTAFVRVTVQDINEFAPRFTQDQYNATVLEEVNPSVIVLTVRANDSEAQNAITYDIVTGSTADFSLGSTTGILSTRRRLDRETVPQYVLTLQAVDGVGITGRTSYTQVTVTVGDVNDNTPMFPLDSVSYLIPESSPPSTALAPSVMATDTDSGANGAISYSLMSSDSHPFEVDSSTGVVTLTQTLDRETTPTYTLIMQAVDGGAPRRTGSIELRVTVTDVNDRSPDFDQTIYDSSVPENSPEGVSVITVTATDGDSMDTLEYDITDGDSEGQFRMNRQSGLISTGAVPLDREQQAQYTLTVTVTDSDLRTDEVEVVVGVADLNDNSPQFSSDTYSSTHEEDNGSGLVVAIVTATDIDEGSNGEVEYRIAGGNSDNIFDIDPNSGEVVARAGGLDYERQQVHTLTIEATDRASPDNLRLFSTAVLTVVVEDVNDNRPTFSQAEYRTSVNENAVLGTTVAVLTATDGDSGTNGEIIYSFGTTSSSIFSINSTTGVVTVTGEVNFEMGQEYELSVEARDRGNPQRSSVAALHVQVINAEDESPRFPISFYTAEISEDEPSESPVLTVTATDPDGSDSLEYDIIPSSNVNSYFRINTATGEISTAGTLDREEVAVVDLQVVATDSAGLNGTATVQITIGDVNDNPPEFLAMYYTVALRENSAVGTTIIPFFEGNSTRVEARDRDGPGLNSEVSYDKEGEDSDKFSVDKSTGIVTVAAGAVLDREEDETLVFTITAEDHGTPTLIARVTMTITLLDENDNPPTFVPPFGYAVLVPEDEAVGTVLLTAVANDPDLLGGGEVSFRRATSSPLSKLSCFSVNSTTGAITLEDSLDREQDPLISLTISAHDSGVPSLVASTTVQITVTDVNDNRPQFSQETYIATVSEQHTVGASVLTVVAVDPDSGTNGQVEYDIASPNSPLAINQDTGEVSTRAPLDYESQRRHDIIMQACDKAAVDRNCSTAEVVVYVTDFNDEFPLFDFSTYRTDLCHSHPPNEVFIQPVAFDRDSGSNAELTYSLDDSGLDLMDVWPATGRVYLVRGVATQEVGLEFAAVITATDGGNPRLLHTARVVVRMINCTSDDFRFELPLFEVETDEELSGDGTILTPTNAAAINTIPARQQVTFNPGLQNNPFALHFNLLAVAESDMIDRETRELYTLPVASTSAEGDTAFATITVRVLDANDNIPQLQLPELSFIVAENASEGVYVTTALATDDDIGANAAIQFLPLNSDFFTINNTTGVVTTVTALDREKIPEHQLTIQASDGTFPSEAITITVTVSDINDNYPEFSEVMYSVAVVENSPPGTSVLTVVATDGDLGDNAAITFSVVAGDLNIFSLNSETGVVRTTQGLDYETQSQFSLTVRATDKGAPVLSSDVEINITVEDFNDHTPTFLNPVTSVSVSEGVAEGTVLADFNVTDSDSGGRGVLGVRFSIVAGNTDLFSVNSVSGILKTEALLDRDVGPPCHFLSIQATDSAGDNSLSNVTEIEVCLIDDNDNCPLFIQPAFSGQVPEDEDINQQLLLRVQAMDADSDKSTNGDVEYRLLEDGGVFDVDPSTGFLSLSSTLDTELVSSYELVVEACDGGEEPCCTNTTIAIDVLDVNDNPPVILNINSSTECLPVLETNSSYSCAGSVQEVGDVVFTVAASDVDSGVSGAVLYGLVVDSPAFQLAAGGVLTIAGELDYEAQQTYQLYIHAYDQGVPLSLTSEIEILCITVEDINDRAPAFSTDNTYSVSQDEGSIPQSALIHIVATDDDAGTNADISYSITSGNTSIFSINEGTGQLYLLEELDCEATGSYSLTVTANNSLSKCPLSSSVEVVVTVNDVNDNSPVFSEEVYNTTVAENIAISSTLLTIRAEDADKNSPNNDVIYRLELGSGPNPFHLDQNTGTLTVQNPLDAETLLGGNYTFTVVVEDKGFPVLASSASVVITVEDVNDQAPVFSQDSYSVAVSEGEGFSPSLLSLSFSDPDILPENRASHVAITSVAGYGSQLFSVNENSSLLLQAALDRENTSSYDIIVTVNNIATCYLPGGGECASTAKVVVTVTDVNDNSPQFTAQSYSGEVSVTASIGTSVLEVEATDADSGSFKEVRYRIEDTLSGRFRVDEESGVIFTRGSFDNLDGQRLTLMVTAYDNLGATPSQSSTTAVKLVVLNDFQRISVQFACGINTVVQKEMTIIEILANVSGLNIQVESYADHSDDIASNFIFHATDPETNEIVDFDEFFVRLQGSDGSLSAEADLVARLGSVCTVEKITAFANIEDYQYPDALDTQTIVIFVLCVILAAGAFTSLVLAVRQRWVALHDTRSKLLADVFYGSPGSTSLVENVQTENFQLEEMDLKGERNRQNPMFVQPYDNWQGVDASGPESTGDVSSMNRDNPLYESQEIRMEMFAESDEEEGDEADDAELLAAALKEDDEPEDNSVTAI